MDLYLHGHVFVSFFMDCCFVNRGWEEVDLISCQLCPHCTNLLDWQDSMCEHVGMDGWVSLVTVCLRLLQEGTHTFEKGEVSLLHLIFGIKPVKTEYS